MYTPKSEADAADIIKAATSPLSINGGGTRGFKAQGTPLCATGMSGISLYEPGALTLVAGAGTPLAEIEQALIAENQRLAFEPPNMQALLGTHGSSTIGGIVAANASGARRIQVGACRDHTLGVRFIDGSGAIIKNGGRVMKNVTGYDLVKLMSGSYGTLGVLTEVSLKVQPVVETQSTLVLHGLAPDRAVAAMSRALGSPFEITGAAYDAATSETYLRIEGFAASIAYRTKQLTALLSTYGDITVRENALQLWDDISGAKPLANASGDIWRISVKPSDAPAVLNAINASQSLLDWGGGLIWAAAAKGTDLRSHLGRIPGHATLVRGAGATIPQFHPQIPALEKLGAGLRAKFDPRGILNTGLMGAPL